MKPHMKYFLRNRCTWFDNSSFLIIILIAILTWIIPAGTYETDKAGNIISGTYKAVTNNPQGIWDVFMAPVIGMVGDKKTDGAISVSLFILVIGGFLGVVNKTNALNEGIGSIVRRYKGREKQLIPILMLLFALGGSTYGMGGRNDCILSSLDSRDDGRWL